jgi:hypothetical protein
MNIYIAKHYWKDGENATWECHEKIDKELFKYLKDNYTLFINDKPKILEKYQQFIHICYEDTTDVFGRTITNVTFFVMKKKLSMEFCTTSYSNLEIKTKKFEIKTFLIIGITLFILGGLYIFVPKIKSVPPSSKIVRSNINSLDIEKEEVNQLSIKVKKEQKIKEEFNQAISLKLKEHNQTVTSRRSFDKIHKTWKYIKPKLKDNVILLTYENREKLKELNQTISTYSRIFRNGVECNLTLEKLNKIVSFKTFKINKKDFFGSLVINEKKYELHIVIENKKTFFKSKKVFDKEFEISDIELIKLYNDEVLFKEIDNSYRIKIKKINTGDSNGK